MNTTKNIIAGRVGRGTKVHRLLDFVTGLDVSCGAGRARGVNNPSVRKVEGGADAITCERCQREIADLGYVKESSDYRHGENGAWVYAQNCTRAGHVVSLEEVEAFSEVIEGEVHCPSDWSWWAVDYAKRTLADEELGAGPNHVFRLRAAANVVRYTEND